MESFYFLIYQLYLFADIYFPSMLIKCGFIKFISFLFRHWDNVSIQLGGIVDITCFYEFDIFFLFENDRIRSVLLLLRSIFVSFLYFLIKSLQIIKFVSFLLNHSNTHTPCYILVGHKLKSQILSSLGLLGVTSKTWKMCVLF